MALFFWGAAPRLRSVDIILCVLVVQSCFLAAHTFDAYIKHKKVWLLALNADDICLRCPH